MWGRERALGLVLPALFPWVTWRPVFSTLGFSIYSEPFLLRHVALGGSYVQRPLKVSVCGWFTVASPQNLLPGHGGLGLSLTPMFVFVFAETESLGRGEDFHQGWGRVR